MIYTEVVCCHWYKQYI